MIAVTYESFDFNKLAWFNTIVSANSEQEARDMVKGKIMGSNVDVVVRPATDLDEEMLKSKTRIGWIDFKLVD